MRIASATDSTVTFSGVSRRLRTFLLPAVVGVIGVSLLVMALVPELIAPYPPNQTNIIEKLQPPFGVDGGSMAHPLGTDALGRDLWSRVVWGTRVSLQVAALAIFASGTVGTVIGLLSGFYGGTIDSILMRLTDSIMSLPIILIALLIAVTMGPSVWNVIIAISLVLWTRYTRLIRAEVISLKHREFVNAARAAGSSNMRILSRHIFPNVVNTLVVMLSLQVGYVILLEASLSFLGAGVPPPTPAWGSMTAAGRDYITTAWWLSVFPGIAIMGTVLVFNLFGDWLRDKLDPKLRHVRV